MSRKRRIFDIDMPEMEAIPATKVPDPVVERRRGPMATAISENADALRNRQETEDRIRAENDKLAHELVRLKKEGLITDLVPLDAIRTEKLTRDRADGPDPELEELKTSIREIGLSNPIRVEQNADGSYELVQGMRRLSAYRALFEETGDDRYLRIPAGILSEASRDDQYRRMVDENLIRKDISFAEMGALARAYAEDPENECEDVDKAVSVLFKSASYTKRSYIRAFASLLSVLGASLAHANDIPRNLGVDLKRRLDVDPDLVLRLQTSLAMRPERTSAEELAILRGALEGEKLEGKGGAAPVQGVVNPRKAKTTFQISRSHGVAKCSASNGRIDLRYNLDFTRIDRNRLEQAVARLIDDLQDD
ncbi:ParB/RepB/Spo0J family partition protein [Ruegeria marina]|uniref:Chromosome partitioning protein, ParB family n=1 Tax=Ruegeria marina TaxID=639004 RepID=A0A1G7CSA1_9RHOB|nr:ParB N-terminal domain-containing protein [Ruegeria marina]SDE42232.1 chromosome partitioning protein, ParB family [Ruegeria marina]